MCGNVNPTISGWWCAPRTPIWSPSMPGVKLRLPSGSGFWYILIIDQSFGLYSVRTEAMRHTLEVQSRAMQHTIETQGRQVSRLARGAQHRLETTVTPCYAMLRPQKDIVLVRKKWDLTKVISKQQIGIDWSCLHACTGNQWNSMLKTAMERHTKNHGKLCWISQQRNHTHGYAYTHT